jgi:ABC-type uncharacterized transport system permease subunit
MNHILFYISNVFIIILHPPDKAGKWIKKKKEEDKSRITHKTRSVHLMKTLKQCFFRKDREFYFILFIIIIFLFYYIYFFHIILPTHR